MSLKSSSRVKQKRRLGEGWVSYNRVLIGNLSSKKNVGRNPNFDTDETKLLIQLWGDPKVQRTLITTHKKHSVICQLAAQMQEYGYYRSPEEITTRIKNLKCFYNRLKKEMEAGQPQSEPSWRHYNEMDAIMTRPIFSVRPNEVPQPSLKYQLEQRKQEREERRKKILEEGGIISENEDDLDEIADINKSNINDIDDGIIPDVEVDMDINDEAFAALTAVDAAQTISPAKKHKLVNGDLDSDPDGADDDDDDNDDDDDDEKTLQIKEEEDEEFESNDKNANTCEGTQEKSKEKDKAREPTIAIVAPSTATANNDKNTIVNGALIIPKEEPIDVDAEDDDEKKDSTNVGALMPTLAEMLKMTKSKTAQGSTAATTTISNLTTTNPSTSIAASSTATAITTAATAVATTAAMIATQPSPQAKISLVPTNFLLQQKPQSTATPQTQTIQLLPNVNTSQAQMPQRIILSQAGGTANPTGIVTTGPGGMKVLLVNAEQAGGKATLTANALQQHLTANCMSKALGAVVANSNKLQQSQQQQQQQLHTHQQQFQQMLQNQHQQQNSNDDLAKRKQKKKQKFQATLLASSSSALKSKEEEVINRKEAASMRILIRQLLAAQEKNNDIQRERLIIERERLDFEKSAVDRLIAAMPNIFNAQQIPLQQPPQQVHLQASTGLVSGAPTTMLFNPSKLIFTSAGAAAFATNVPTAAALNGGATVFAPANSNFATPLSNVAQVQAQMEACSTPINDFQLLTPKLEKEE